MLIYKGANELIASLKSRLAAQSDFARETQSLKKKLEAQSLESEKLQAHILELTSSIKELRTENKGLATKLAVNRNAAASIESTHSRNPESARKINGAVRMVGSAEAIQAAQTASLTEDLYSDLTGLIVRGVQRDEEEDVFDCIQTGRNGSKLILL